MMALFTGACTVTESPKSDPSISDVGYFVKTDIDTVADIHVQESLGHLRTLMEKLYRRNPKELRKGQLHSIQENLIRVFDGTHDWQFPELQNKTGTECINLAFSEEYSGDRVQAFVVGLTTMIIASYNNKTQFYAFDELDAQKLYNSARNIEIAVWKLGQAKDASGRIYLLSNSMPGEPANLSFERLFGKLIAQQDTMAKIVAQKTNRAIRSVVQTLASAVFLPI